MHTIPISPKKEGIQRYLSMKLDNDPEPGAMDDNLRKDILKMIPETISEIFLLVSLSIESVLEEVTIARRRKKLKEVTKGQGVDDLYTTTLERIRVQKGGKAKLGMEVLRWIYHSERPLRPEELCHVLAIDYGTSELDRDNIPSIRTLLSSSLGLATVDSSSSTVRLVHFTLQEYLLAHPLLFHSTHIMIAEVCLTYLNFQEVRNLSPTLESAPSSTPFLQYASCYWGAHARKETSERMILLATRLLADYDSHISSKLLLLNAKSSPRIPYDKKCSLTGFTGLHAAAFLGIDKIMVDLLSIREWDLNACDIEGDTALAWAAIIGSVPKRPVRPSFA
ncbi:hypothetical protein L873DRAFT_1813690 [Choiromyces venosus 120613-1]|uniref:GPI inositol-deacylase winged helix domain-containing protein n=1 Tax=Choiromyces venosus 120613-1 TaxID=1336337 RepID=A0A3N4JD17_9PEZI|nr:hypothetical protein L873DRAFT_1813690 [Choiromyces venosus 120613-1]